VPDPSIFDVAASLDNLEPTKISQAPRRLRKRILDRIFNAIRGGAHKFDLLVDVIAHTLKINAPPLPTTI
jgi:hypothetical protein